jgi:hypothetical protein
MNETELLNELNSLRGQGKIDEGIRLLKENTGKGKTIDPSNTSKMESIWSSFANPFLFAGQLDDFIKICGEMSSHLMHLQDQGEPRYHKGWSRYSIGLGFLRKAFHNFLLSFVEDSISLGAYPEEALSTAALQGIFKADSDFLRQLSEKIVKQEPAAKDPNGVLSNLGIKGVPAELWTIEYQMQETERKLREFIRNKLSDASPEWWEKLVPDELKREVDNRMTESSEILWFSEQPISPVEYLTFPKEYIKIITCDNCWPYFKDSFKHKAILQGRLEGLGHIRHKVAHYRKISDDEKQMFNRTIQWLQNCIK